MIFIDFETTGLPDKATYPIEVLSLTATKVDQDCRPITTVTRYYYHEQPTNLIQTALKINGLTKQRVDELRMEQSSDYPLLYKNDQAFWIEFFNDLEYLVTVATSDQPKQLISINAFNIDFDRQFLPTAVMNESILNCTMREVSFFLGLEVGKRLTLAKSCQVLGIQFDKDQAHGSLYDTQKAIEVWRHVTNSARYRKCNVMYIKKLSVGDDDTYRVLINLEKTNKPMLIEVSGEIGKDISKDPSQYKYAVISIENKLLRICKETFYKLN